MKERCTVLVIFVSVLFSGCAHSPLPYLPSDVLPLYTDNVVQECNQDSSCLQVLVIYGKYFCSHTSLRIQSGNNALFWDPAGGYGRKGSVVAQRTNDVFMDNAPTLNEYILFRKEISTSAMEIFEWQIGKKEAEDLITTLASNRGDADHGEKFSTTGIGLFCSSFVSDFLERFSENVVDVQKTFFPHDLANQLYQQKPSRVIIVNFEKSFTIATLSGEDLRSTGSKIVKLDER